MNESIIRRFAKYHGIDVTAVAMAPTAPWGGIANLASAIYGSCHTEHVAKVIQTLTRIEDAEAAMDLAKAWAAGDPQSNALYIHADKMFTRAGVSMRKWLEVKE